MNRMIFVNLPVSDLAVATDFYTGLGFDLNPAFSDADCSCVVVSETICVMLLTRDRFADFVVGPVGDASTATTSITCLSARTRQEVDDLHHRALAHGGKPWKDLVEQGPMYGHSFTDPDGHVWEVLHMDLAAA